MIKSTVVMSFAFLPLIEYGVITPINDTIEENDS